ncbi:MAG: efflux RND transporter permease subunit [Singulisphaera sp.]
MLNSIIRLSLQNRSLVIALSILLMGFGGYVATNMPVDVFPDLTAPTVTVITEAHGMAPVEVETLVSFPIEASMNGAANVRRVRSATAVGISVVWVEFEWGTDIYAARQVVSEKLGLITGSLPPEVEKPILAPISSIMGEILFLSLTSDRHSGIELRTAADTIIRRRLLSVPGVSQVVPIGGGEKQYQVVLSPSKLHAYRLSSSDVSKRLAQTNQNASAGILVEGGQELLIQGIGRVRTNADIAETVVTVRDGVPVRVGQLGVVQIGEAIKRGEGSAGNRGHPRHPEAAGGQYARPHEGPRRDARRGRGDAPLGDGGRPGSLPASELHPDGHPEREPRPEGRRHPGRPRRRRLPREFPGERHHAARHPALAHHGRPGLEGARGDHQHDDPGRDGDRHRRAGR